jgi:transcriptional regulator with XRE-family HTH domain
MASLTQKLIADVQAWCDEAYGRQAQLARLLGVSRQSVSGWLSGRKSPTSEQALWLSQFMATQRKPGRPAKTETKT